MQKRKKITKILSLCLAFVGVLATTSCEGFISLIKGNTPTENSTPPHPNWYWEKEEGVLINSLDKWYYYAGKKTLEEYFASSLNCTESTGEIVPVADYGYGYETSDGKVIEGEPPVDNGNIPPSNDTVVYYDLCDFNELVVNRTVYFQMELTDSDGFLARRLGTGMVEVVVSLGDYDEDLSMITFRNGDRFYSCMYHGYGGLNEETGAEKYYFAAYRYIEGFYYVKNLKWEHYEFCVEVGKDNVSFTCNYRYTGENNETPSVIEGSYYCVNETVRYTIEELETYFGGSDAEKEENSSSIEGESIPMDSVKA